MAHCVLYHCNMKKSTRIFENPYSGKFSGLILGFSKDDVLRHFLFCDLGSLPNISSTLSLKLRVF